MDTVTLSYSLAHVSHFQCNLHMRLRLGILVLLRIFGKTFSD